MYLTNTQNTATDYYFTGSISNHYGTTSTSYHDGFYVYFENHSSGNGRNLYFYEDNNTANAKKYIYANYVVSNNKTYYNFEFNASEPTNPWTYNSEGGYIQIEASNGQVCIPGTYNQYNTFGMVTYVSATTYTAKFAETAETFSYYLLNKMTCDDTGETEPVFDSNYSWSNLNTLFTSLNTLDSSEANRLVTASASEGGNLIEQAMARYNYLIWKYGENKYNNFIGRNIVSPNLSLTNYVNSGDSNILLIIVAISSVSLCALFVLSYRKRKHN